MNELETILGLILFPAGCTAFGAAAVFVMGKSPKPTLQRGMLGFAAGIMLAASVWSLLLPAIDYAEQQAAGGASWISPVAGFCLGAAGLLVCEWIGRRLLFADGAQSEVRAGQQAQATNAVQTGDTMPEKAETVNAGRVIFAITLHNLPEGMIVGLAAALALAGDVDALVGATALSLGIGIQNIPEGASVSLPMYQSGKGRFASFLGGAASGIVEPLGAVIAILLASLVTPWMPWMLAAAAGAMVCVAAEDMIPLAMAKGRVGVISVVAGFAVMMALDVALG